MQIRGHIITLQTIMELYTEVLCDYFKFYVRPGSINLFYCTYIQQLLGVVIIDGGFLVANKGTSMKKIL